MKKNPEYWKLFKYEKYLVRKDYGNCQSALLKYFFSYLVILADVFIFFPAVVLFFAQQKLQLQDKVRWLSAKRYQVLKFFLQ